MSKKCTKKNIKRTQTKNGQITHKNNVSRDDKTNSDAGSVTMVADDGNRNEAQKNSLEKERNSRQNYVSRDDKTNSDTGSVTMVADDENRNEAQKTI